MVSRFIYVELINLMKTLKEKLKKLKNIKLMGYVYNLNTLASSCHACLFPIDVPVGNRSRIVTAMGVVVGQLSHMKM